MKTNMIGNKLTEARKKTNLSQAQLAQHLFISPQAVGKWERGESLPDILTLCRIAEILGVDLNYFSKKFAYTITKLQSPESPEQPVQPPLEKPARKIAWDMSRGNWTDADFSGLKNLHEKFSSSNLQRCKFIDSDLSRLLLEGNNVDRCDFRGSNLSGSQIQRSNIGNNQFNDCLMNEAELSASNIGSCDFTGTDFTGATIKYCNFEKNTMNGTVLNRTAFNGTSLDQIVFDGTLEDCSFENCSFYKVIFQNCTLTNTFFKNNGKMKKAQFIDCKADQLTYAFLKNANADLSGITLLQ